MGGSLDAYEAQDRKIIEPVGDDLEGSLSDQVVTVWQPENYSSLGGLPSELKLTVASRSLPPPIRPPLDAYPLDLEESQKKGSISCP